MNPERESVVVITGAASGLGLYISERFLENGWKVLSLDKRQHPDPRVIGFVLDLAETSELARIAQDIQMATPSVDVLVHAATAYNMRPLDEYAHNDTLSSDTSVNFIAPLVLTSALLPALNNGHFPLVVAISSNAAYGSPFCAHYVMSKGALNSMIHAINEEFRINGTIRGSIISFGSIDVGLTTRANLLAITARRGHDPVIAPSHASEVVFEVANNRSHRHVVETKINPHKANIR